MKLHTLLCLIWTILVFACSDNTQSKPEHYNQPGKILKHIKPQATFSDTLIINSTAAIFYSPDSVQLEKIKSITDAMVYEGTMHEYFYLMRNAHFVIKKNIPKLKIIEAKNVRYLLFIKADKSKICIDLNTKKEPYGLFVFNRKDPPELVDMANIESDLGFYFSR